MLNQAAVEAIYSATYIENYLDFVENLPDELQRYVSRVRELDLTFNAFLKEVEQQRDALSLEVESSTKKKGYLSKVQQALIFAQEVGDEKLQLLQQVQDIIENRTRQLDLDNRNLADIGKEQDLPEPVKEPIVKEPVSVTPAVVNNGNSSGERQSKRVRRTRTDIAPADSVSGTETIATPEPVRQASQSQQQTPSTNSVSNSTQKKSATASVGKKKKRKNRQGSQSQGSQQSTSSTAQRDESPPRDDEMAIDPDEPTYCLCDQISYGEMIMCDNDLCPFEWFHFSCVTLTSKPKGKWYCPKCRGDRSSVMKPKAQFMKELEKIKQEKQEKQEKELKEEKGS